MANDEQLSTPPTDVEAMYVNRMPFIASRREGSFPLRITQSWARKSILKKTELGNCGAKNILPRSGLILTVVQKGSDSFQFKSSGFSKNDFHDKDDWPTNQKITLNGLQSKIFFKTLRLVQMLVDGHANRLSSSKKEHCLIPSALVDTMKALEDALLDGHADPEDICKDLNRSFKVIENLYLQRVNTFIRDVNEYDPENKVDKFDEIPLTGKKTVKFENDYVEWKSTGRIEATSYLSRAPSPEVDNHVQFGLRSGLKEIFSFPESDIGQIATLSSLAHPYPLPKLRLSIDEPSPYDEIVSLCDTIEPHKEKMNEADAKKIVEVKKICNSELTFKLMLDPATSPRILKEKIIKIMEDNEMYEVIESTLQKELPGMYEKAKREEYGELLRTTSDVRGRLSSYESRLKGLDSEIQALSEARDMKYEQQGFAIKLHELRVKLKLARERNNEDAIDSDLNEFDSDLDTFESSLEGDADHSASLRSSVLWVGLGQGGSQILRECLLYCFDNINDARAGSLLSSLGIKPGDLIELMKNRNSTDSEIKKKAEETLKEICDKKLQVLAVNIGSDIDKLVVPGRPGYFLWGDSDKSKSDTIDVVRKTRNTLRLDAKMDGAGGATGLGRAFGFARRTQIRNILADVGKKHTRRSPTHVIITHSYAGGSGSGMTLTILQEIRRSFDADTIIWVMSVGEGDSEDRSQAVYNTPFIISDVLQAHYDGIHAPMDILSSGEWETFKIELTRGRNAMLKQVKELMKLVAPDKDVEGEDEMKTLKNWLELGSSYTDRAQSMKSQSRFLDNYSNYKPDEIDVDHTDFGKLIELLPSNPDETKKFNKWCEVFEDAGARPALNFWSSWIECVTDPLGLFVTGESEIKKANVDSQSEDERRKDFSEALSEKNLEQVMRKLELEHELITENENIGNQQLKTRELDRGLDPLYQMLKKKWTSNEDVADKVRFIDAVKSIFRSYKSSLRGYNNQRRELTRRIRALTGSSNDERVKNIVISNAHLERGVKASSISVVDNSYTVYNSVIFDFILNIIGSQIPPEGTYLATSAEEFDEQDLVQHTKSPLVVGLIEHRDSLSLGERTLPDRTDLDVGIGTVLKPLFLQPELWDGKENPLYCLESLGGVIYLLNSLFDSRAISMLQNNPYDTTNGRIVEPEKLVSLIAEFESRWESDGELLALDHIERKNIEDTYGCSSLHFGNIIRWISAIHVEVLANILSATYHNNARPKDRRSREVESILKKLKKWEEYVPDNQSYDDSRTRENTPLDNYQNESGYISKESLKQVLPMLGIWHDNMLRSVPPSYLNAYLPPLLLEYHMKNVKKKSKDKDYDSEKEALKDELNKLNWLDSFSLWDSSNQIHSGLLKEPNRRKDLNEILEEVDLQIELFEQKSQDLGMIMVPKLRLHPRLQRYLSALRSLPTEPNDYFLPARSTAGLLPRYLMANKLKEKVGSYSVPTFQKAGEILNWYRYIGLLPDESKFEWPSLLRMLLLCDTDYEHLNDRLSNLSAIMSINLDDYSDDIQSILEIKYETSGLTIYKSPSKIWDQMTVLRNRMIRSIQLADKLILSSPISWREGSIGLETWKEIISATNLVDDDSDETEDVDGFAYQNSTQVEETIMDFQIALFNQSKESIMGTTEVTPEPVHHVRRLVYDIMTLMREALLQAAYQSKNAKSERVHFEMTGFSDIISGVPGGLLCLNHDKGAKMDKGRIQETIRKNVHASLGYLNTNKEFSTASRFGPNASTTLVLMKSPINEAARQFSLAMGRLKGTSRDDYLNLTKLHPYVFLYNLLWLPTNIERWVPADNDDYIRRFQIPLEVIENHYMDPQKTVQSLKSINREQSFKTGGISLPEDDIRDFENCKKDGNYRNITNLLGIMALRHNHALGNPAEGPIHINEKEILTAVQHKELVGRHGRKGDVLSKECLDPKSVKDGGDIESEVEDPWAKDENTPPSPENNGDTIENRRDAWFKAYINWYDYAKGKDDADSGNLDLSELRE